jgi:hypothetical protein
MVSNNVFPSRGTVVMQAAKIKTGGGEVDCKRASDGSAA